MYILKSQVTQYGTLCTCTTIQKHMCRSEKRAIRRLGLQQKMLLARTQGFCLWLQPLKKLIDFAYCCTDEK